MSTPKQFLRSVDFLSTEESTNTSNGAVNIFGGMSVSKTSYLTNTVITGDTTIANIYITGNLMSSTGTSLISSQFTSINSGSAIYFGTSGNAFVGIGTTTPTFQLDISGGSRITGGLTVGSLTVVSGSTIPNILASTISTGTLNTTNISSANSTMTNIISTNISSGTLLASSQIRIPGIIQQSFTRTFSTTANGVGNIASFNTITCNFDIDVMITGTFQTYTAKYKISSGYNMTSNTWSRCIPYSYYSSNTDAYELQLQVINNSIMQFRLVHSTPSIASTPTVNFLVTHTQNNIPVITDLTTNAETIDSSWATYNFSKTTALTQFNNQVGINTIIPAYTLDVSGGSRISTSLTTGALYSTNITSSNIVGTNISSGTLNLSNILKAGFNSNTLGNLYTTGGNIGINNTAPAFNLDIIGTANITGTVNVITNISVGGTIFSSGAGIRIAPVSDGGESSISFSQNTANAGINWRIGHNTNLLGSGYLGIYNSAYNNNAMIITTSGNTIFGSGGPVYVMSAYAILTANSNVNDWPANSGSIGNAIAFRVRGGDNASMDMGVNSAHGGWIQCSNFASGYNSFPLILNPNGGNVGINTTSPGFKLDVSGNSRISTSLTTGALYSTNITSSNIVGTNISSGTLNLSNILKAGFNSNTLGNLYTTGGNIGINTTSPVYTLDVNGTLAINNGTFTSTRAVIYSLGNLQVQWLNTTPSQLAIALVSGTNIGGYASWVSTYNGTGIANSPTSTTFVSVASANAAIQGDTIIVSVSLLTSSTFYRVTAQVGTGFNNNPIIIEKLI
jgi:hypothetical protein